MESVTLAYQPTTQAIGGASSRALIAEYLEQVKADIIEASTAKRQPASGKTLKSLEVVSSHYGGKLMANSNIIYLETGRGPTHPTGPYMQSEEGTLLEIITKWIAEKGLDLSPWAVTQSIHKHGTRLYRQGGKSGVLSIPLREERIKDLFDKITLSELFSVTSEIYEPIKNLKL